MTALRDTLNRPLRDLRLSVTDRCNLRCPYCMPKEVFGPSYPFLRDPQLLTLDELKRVCALFQRLGVVKLRVTGGEPLLRRDVPELARHLKRELRLPDVALTTNAWRLAEAAPALAEAGLDRVNVSLDALDPRVAGLMNGRGLGPDRALRGIDAALAAGLRVKINMVVVRGINESQILPMAEMARERRVPLRFIEFMDVGNHNHWRMDQVVPSRDILALLRARWPLEPVEPAYAGEVAVRHRYVDGGGEVGFISSVTAPFCGDCHRARLSADGKLFTCLFASVGWDLLTPLREGASDAEMLERISHVWARRSDRYSEERAGLLREGQVRAKADLCYLVG